MILKKIVHFFNWPILFVTLILSIMGLVNLYSATSSFGNNIGYNFFNSQLIASLVGVFLILIINFFHYRHFYSWSYFLYGLSILLLFLVLVVGKNISGHQSWIEFFGFRIQPSEIAKLGLILALSRVLVKSDSQKKLGFIDLIPSFIIFLIPTILVMLQGDLGSSLFFGLIYSSVILIHGVDKKVIFTFLGLLIVGCFIAYLFLLSPYQKDRIKTFVNPELDKKGAGYQLVQSKIAVGSGGLSGRGYLKGQTHKLKFIPERHTDFVFPVLAEEWGFLGGFSLLMAFGTLFYLCLKVAKVTADKYSYFLVIGVMFLFFWHLIVNLGGVLGLMPLTGVPLPFFSYGRSSLMTSYLAIGLVLCVSYRRYAFKPSSISF